MANTINLGRVKGSMWYTGTADSASAIASELSSLGYTPLKLDKYLNTNNGDLYEYSPVSDILTWTLKGNLRGARGESFKVDKTYRSVAEMNAAYSNDGLPVGAFVVIDTGDVNDEDNAKLYYKGETQYVYLTDLSGAQGIKGDTGEAAGFGEPTATAEALEAGATPTVVVTASGGATAKVFTFKFGIPKGDTGEKGVPGEKGADGKTPTLSVNENGELIATFD